MKRKKAKKVIAILMALFIVLLVPCESQAAYKYYSSYSFTKGMLWWKHNYTCKVYKDTIPYYTIYYGSIKVSTGFDFKPNYKEPIIISQTADMSIGSQTVSSMNAEVDLSKFKVPAKVGGSMEKTTSQSWGIANTINRTVSADDPIGYYSYNIMINLSKIRLDLYKDGKKVDSESIWAPKSEPYRGLVFSPNATYNNATKYY